MYFAEIGLNYLGKPDLLKKYLNYLSLSDVDGVTIQILKDSFYKDYFKNSENYYITNWIAEARGLQEDIENQIFLDLEKDLDKNLENNFDVVFNHTTLEHIYNFNKAFKNLCKMSKNVVILVVPFMQEQHFNSHMKDYWRFTPLAIKNLFEENNYKLSYINFNDWANESVYIFAIGTKNESNFDWIINDKENKIKMINETSIGKKIITNGILLTMFIKLKDIFSKK